MLWVSRTRSVRNILRKAQNELTASYGVVMLCFCFPVLNVMPNDMESTKSVIDEGCFIGMLFQIDIFIH